MGLLCKSNYLGAIADKLYFVPFAPLGVVHADVW